MSSWYDALADRYGDWSTSVAADVPFYVGLARDADGPLVELAVGTGRVAIPVAQATGRRVLGIDSSPAMLAQARVHAAEEGVELDLREGDIRELEIEERAALIYCPGRSLLHLPTWADRRRCFERVAASLRSNGRFAWNAFAFDHHVASALDGQHADAHAGVPLPHTNHYSVSDNRVDITLDDGGTGSFRWGNQERMAGLLDVAGLRLEALHGGFAGERLDDESREYIFRGPSVSAQPGPHAQRRGTFPHTGAPLYTAMPVAKWVSTTVRPGARTRRFWVARLSATDRARRRDRRSR